MLVHVCFREFIRHSALSPVFLVLFLAVSAHLCSISCYFRQISGLIGSKLHAYGNDSLAKMSVLLISSHFLVLTPCLDRYEFPCISLIYRFVSFDVLREFPCFMIILPVRPENSEDLASLRQCYLQSVL